MKKVFFILSLFAVIVFACSNYAANDKESNKVITTEGIEHLTKTTFLEKVFDYENNKDWKFNGNTPVVIDFYADWCAPCKKMSPILEELNKEYGGKVTFYKIDTQKEQELAQVFGITGIPAFLFIPMDGQPQMSMGYSDKPTFENTIKEILKISK